MQQTISDLKEDVRAANAQQRRLGALLGQAQVDIAVVREAMSGQQQDLDAAKAAAVTMKAQMTGLQQDLALARTATISAQAEANGLREEVKALQAEVAGNADLEAQVTNLKEAAKDAHAKQHLLEGLLAQAQVDGAIWRDVMAGQQQDLAAAKAAASTMQVQVASLQQAQAKVATTNARDEAKGLQEEEGKTKQCRLGGQLAQALADAAMWRDVVARQHQDLAEVKGDVLTMKDHMTGMHQALMECKAKVRTLPNGHVWYCVWFRQVCWSV